MSPIMKGKYCPVVVSECAPLILFHFRRRSMARMDRKQDVHPKIRHIQRYNLMQTRLVLRLEDSRQKIPHTFGISHLLK